MRRPTTVVLRVVSVPAECRASPTVHLLDWGERVPYIEPFSPPPLDPPSPVARSTTHPSPRARFTRVLDVRSSSTPRREQRLAEAARAVEPARLDAQPRRRRQRVD